MHAKKDRPHEAIDVIYWARFRDIVAMGHTQPQSATTRYSDGEYVAVLDMIGEHPPTDCITLPVMLPGQWGLFLANKLHERKHSPYALAVARNKHEAEMSAMGFFRRQLTPWRELLL